MASSSSPVPHRKYDVFLSFRGTDTRRGFLSHLHKALCEKNIETFIDYKLEEGSEISPSLLTAIEMSEISLIMFSKDYAFSAWCLEELAHIIECMEKFEQIVVPIFYDIDPSSVRNQKGSYEDAFKQHERRSKHSRGKLQNWRIALQKAANLSGFPSSNFETEAELIEKVVECVLKRLNSIQQIDLKGFVGIHERIARLESLLCPSSPIVRIIGIWGMGGIGKTTIANILYNRLCKQYNSHHFVENIREKLETCRLTHIKNELLSKLLEDEDLQIGLQNGIPTYARRRLGRQKVLIVLDDITDYDQLKVLIGEHDYFGPGSRIILTSRDKHVLKKESDIIYEVQPLNANEAIQLFNLNASKEGFNEKQSGKLSMKMVDYAEGNPLALKVLGSLLYDKSQDEWESQLEKLGKMTCPRIKHLLKLSYDGLDDEEKDIFLYLACFFQNDPQERITSLLDACGYSTTIGLRDLQDKALITISNIGFVSMHNLMREMGREIVREKSHKDLGKYTHLWDPNDIYQVLKNNMGTEAIESMRLDMSTVTKELHFTSPAFARMVNLKFFELHWIDDQGGSNDFVCIDEAFRLQSQKLRSLHWAYYPLQSLSSSFCAEYLVELNMNYSRVQRLWEGTQDLVSLKKIILYCSPNLLELPDLSKARNLATLDLRKCISLRCLGPSNLSSHELACLFLSGCKRLRSVRSDISLRSLVYLTIHGCSSLIDFSVASHKITRLDLSWTAIEELHSSIGQLNMLEELHLNDCQNLQTLPKELSNLRSLQRLMLDNCCNLTKLPDNIGFLSSLYCLSIDGSNMESLPASIQHLLQLLYLSSRDCKRLRSLPELPSSLECLDVSNCTSLGTLVFPSNSLRGAQQLNFTLKFKNCVKLDEQALKVIVMSYQLRIQAEAYKHVGARRWVYVADVYFPGRRVPDCFSYKTTQGPISFTLELPPHSKLMGFIFCSVNSQMEKLLTCKYHYKSQSSSVGLVFGGSSNHVYLCYNGEFSLDIMYGIERVTASEVHEYRKVSFEFFLELSSETMFVDMIEEWGIHPIYVLEEHNLLLGAKRKRCRSIDDDLQLSHRRV